MRVSRTKNARRRGRLFVLMRAAMALCIAVIIAFGIAWFWYGLGDEIAVPAMAATSEYPQDERASSQEPPPGRPGHTTAANLRATPLERPPFPHARPEREIPADPAQFADAIFFGDAMTAAIPFYGMAPGAGVMAFAEDSPATAAVRTMTVADEALSLPEAAKAVYGARGNVFISFGAMSLTTQTEDFIVGYGHLIDLIRESFPTADIFVQSIPPITYAAARSHPFLTNALIHEHNLALMELARQRGVLFLDIAYALTDETGHLSPGAAPADGIHIGAQSHYIWIDYLLRHWH